MDKIELFNALARKARPAHADYTPIESLDVPWPETGLDSMDALMVVIFLSDIYGLPEEAAREFRFLTPAELFTLVDQHKTKEPATLEEAMEHVKW
jgi:acyl carrier protein